MLGQLTLAVSICPYRLKFLVENLYLQSCQQKIVGLTNIGKRKLMLWAKFVFKNNFQLPVLLCIMMRRGQLLLGLVGGYSLGQQIGHHN